MGALADSPLKLSAVRRPEPEMVMTSELPSLQPGRLTISDIIEEISGDCCLELTVLQDGILLQGTWDEVCGLSEIFLVPVVNVKA